MLAAGPAVVRDISAGAYGRVLLTSLPEAVAAGAMGLEEGSVRWAERFMARTIPLPITERRAETEQGAIVVVLAGDMAGMRLQGQCA